MFILNSVVPLRAIWLLSQPEQENPEEKDIWLLYKVLYKHPNAVHLSLRLDDLG